MFEAIIITILIIGVLYIAGVKSAQLDQEKEDALIKARSDRTFDEAALACSIMEESFQKHKGPLRRKMTRLIHVDDYGYEDRSAWEDEKKYFIQKICPRSKFPEFWAEYDRELERYLSSANINVTDEWAKAFFPNDPSKAHEYILGRKADYDAVNDRGLPHYLDSFRNRIDEWFHAETKTNSDYKETFSGVDYENYCAELLDNSGWETRLTSSTGDQGVDIIANKFTTTIVVQCKKSSSPVGNKAVQEAIAGMGYMDADGACVVSNSTYTKSAKELANAHSIRLIHHDDLASLTPSEFSQT